MTNQHSYIACVRESTQSLPDIDNVKPFHDGDDACLNELNAVLRKHNAASRFGINLLHSHFPMEDDEVLLEETDVTARRQTISVIKRADAPEGAIYMDRRLDTNDQQAASDLFDKMSNYSNALLLNKYQSDMGLSREDAVLLFEDVKRFIALCATVPYSLGLSREIDQGWHTFILITKDYAEFCDEYCGRYIHHEPSDPYNLGKDYPSERQKTFSLAQAVFGTLSKNWEESSAKCTHNCTNGYSQ